MKLHFAWLMVVTAIAGLGSGALLADEPSASESHLPEVARDASREYAAARKRLDEEYAASIKRLRDRYVRRLDEARKDALAAEDLDAAQAALAEKARVRNEYPWETDASSSGGDRRLTILHAVYGADLKWVDIAGDLRKLVKQSRLDVNPTLAPLPDPAPCSHKTVVVVYAYRGEVRLSVTRDNEQLTLPKDQSGKLDAGVPPAGGGGATRPNEASPAAPAAGGQDGVQREMAEHYAAARELQLRERALYRAALDAEARGDWAEAVRQYERIVQNVPEGFWQTDIPSRLAVDKALLESQVGIRPFGIVPHAK